MIIKQIKLKMLMDFFSIAETTMFGNEHKDSRFPRNIANALVLVNENTFHDEE